MSGDLEVKTERDSVVGLTDGKQSEAVRVFYRRPSTRRWTTFLLVPDDGQTLEELEGNATKAAGLHSARAPGRA